MRRYTTLYIMLAIAAVALLLGFLVIRQRVQNPPATTQQNNTASDQSQDQNQQTAEPTPAPAPAPAVDTSTVGWQIYNNTKYNFSLLYPPNLKAGTVSGNSVLGTYQVPVRGFHVGPLVLVALKDPSLKQDAQTYFESFYNQALNPLPQTSTEGELTVSCKIDKITNANAPVKSVSCLGEGGPASYAYVTGTDYDVFVDGYSKGFDKQDNGSFTADTDYVKILGTFKFSIATTPNPTLAPTPIIQNFTILADDSDADVKEIIVAKDTIVEITFHVSSTNVYYGGLDFRSPVVNSGTIQAGQSKTIAFTARESFVFTPYWPASEIAKPYTIKITIQ